ncbi:MAG: leucyl aminopeptidase [Candidatus Binatota bacterium]|nr:leucyl aminopeptidase [Candidatus Binatota bacterium]
MTEVDFDVQTGADPLRIGASLLVLPLFEGEIRSQALRALDRPSRAAVLRHARDVSFDGQEGRVLVHRPVSSRLRCLALIGLGKKADVNLDAWRRAGGQAARIARAENTAAVGAFFVGAETDAVVALAEGFALAGYRFDRYRKPDEERRAASRSLTLAGPDLKIASVRRGLDVLRVLVPAIFEARDLVNEPPSRMSAAVLARRAAAIGKKSGVRVEVMGPKKIRALRLEGLLAVNRGSADEPRFVRMTYRPRVKPRARVAIVGKGITFDSGGLSLKPAKSMETMKIDMAGAAAVIATMSVIGRLKPPVHVTGYFPATDNLPSGSAQRPGDVIRYRNGKTVEVLNTDAEGRLVLADALALASEERHDVIIDLATLTGACMVALGTHVAGIMGNRAELVDALVRHGRDAGEPLWQLPLVKEYRDDLKSSIADLKNIGGAYAGAILGGLFLQEFVDGAAWAHLDIAGPAYSDRELPYSPRGATGFGVRTLTRYLTSL